MKHDFNNKIQKALILNGGMEYGESKGKLNEVFCAIMQSELKNLGIEVQITHIAQGYEPKSEVAKWKWADCVILQFPGWWMGEPWIVKKYFDEAIGPQAAGILYSSDGRSKNDRNKRYGSGGLCAGKAMMLSTSWNAPLYAFNEVGEFFDGRGVDELFMHTYKIFEFLGFSRFLPSFMANDVHKNPNFEEWERKLIAHIRENFR